MEADAGDGWGDGGGMVVATAAVEGGGAGSTKVMSREAGGAGDDGGGIAGLVQMAGAELEGRRRPAAGTPGRRVPVQTGHIAPHGGGR